MMATKTVLGCLVAIHFVTSSILPALGFVSSRPKQLKPHRPQVSSSSCLFGRKKKSATKPKLTYAQRLQRHREELAKERGEDPPEPVTTTATATVDESPKQLAKELVESQRRSVDMLTFCRERVEALPRDVIVKSLDELGYCVLDNFLANDDVIDTIQAEGCKLLLEGDNQMEQDLSVLGSGEYFAKVVGGQDQYPLIPRTIEWIVSFTKHLPALLGGEDNELTLDDRNCFGTIRTFDPKSRESALALIQGSDIPKRPFGVVATDEDDLRSVSVLYYPISDSWGDRTGGISFGESETTTIPAKRDRLILFKSDTCVHRLEHFFNENELASFLELHLVKKKKEDE